MSQESQQDPTRHAYSLQSFDPATATAVPATLAELAEVLRQDLSQTSRAVNAVNEDWIISLSMAEAVGVLRCLDELAARCEPGALADVAREFAGVIRGRADQALHG